MLTSDEASSLTLAVNNLRNWVWSNYEQNIMYRWCNLNPASEVCETVLGSLFWIDNGCNELPTTLADPTMASLQTNHSTSCDGLWSRYTAGDPEQECWCSDMQIDLMHGSVLVVGQVQLFRPWRSCPGGRGVGEIKKYLLFHFAKYILFLARFTWRLQTSRLHIFKEKSRNLSQSGWRGITFQN